MKKLYLLLSIIILTACSNSDDSESTAVNNKCQCKEEYFFLKDGEYVSADSFHTPTDYMNVDCSKVVLDKYILVQGDLYRKTKCKYWEASN